MDVMTDVLRAVRLSGAVLFRARFSAPWCVEANHAEPMASLLMPGVRWLVPFHAVTRGGCHVALNGRDLLLLDAGDVVMLPRGEAHVVRDVSPAASAHIETVLPPPLVEPPKLEHGGGGDLCGFVCCDEAVFNPIRASLRPS